MIEIFLLMSSAITVSGVELMLRDVDSPEFMLGAFTSALGIACTLAIFGQRPVPLSVIFPVTGLQFANAYAMAHQAPTVEALSGFINLTKPFLIKHTARFFSNQSCSFDILSEQNIMVAFHSILGLMGISILIDQLFSNK